jgi:CDP-glycerol glycerophosphotransferase
MIFGAEAGENFAGNPKYIFLEAQKDPDIRNIWITKNHDIVNKMRAKGYECYHASSLKGIYYQLRAYVAVMSHSIKQDFKGVCMGSATTVNTWHGVGLKRSWFRNKNTYTTKLLAVENDLLRKFHVWIVKTYVSKYNFVISTSKAVSEYYPQTYRVPKEQVFELGQARNDVFYDDSLEEDVPEFLKANKIITYMPTHRHYGKKPSKEIKLDTILDYEQIKRFCEAHGYKFLIKNHIRLKSQKELNTDFIIDITNMNIDPQIVLKYTDILITDYSSCYTDYLLLDRPVIFYCFDLDQYLNDWDLNFDYDYVTPGFKSKSFEELLEHLTLTVTSSEDLFKDERRRVRDIFYSRENQGIVAKKQYEFIKQNIVNNSIKKVKLLTAREIVD